MLGAGADVGDDFGRCAASHLGSSGEINTRGESGENASGVQVACPGGVDSLGNFDRRNCEHFRRRNDGRSFTALGNACLLYTSDAADE